MIVLLIVLVGLTLLALWRLCRPSLDELIKRAKFDHVDRLIRSEKGWSNREGTTNIAPKSYLLVRIDRMAYRSDVDRQLALQRHKYALRTVRYATLRDLMVYAGSRRGWNGQDTVYALDSFYTNGNERRIPCIFTDDTNPGQRVLGAARTLDRFGGDECVLLVVE